MASTSRTTNKPGVKHQALEDNNIYVKVESRFDYNKAPSYLQSFHDSILDFHGVIDVRFEHRNGDVTYNTTSGSVMVQVRTAGHESDQIKHARKLQKMARELTEMEVEEKKWDEFFYVRFFLPLHDTWKPQEDESRAISRQKFFYDKFECHGDKLWTVFNDGFWKKNRVGLTAPKPDRFFAFPIYNTGSKGQGLNESERWRWMGTPKLVDNFSLEILDPLWDKGNGLWSSPCRAPDEDKKGKRGLDSYRTKDQHCFPWLVVEHKEGAMDRSKRARSEEACYCQAANASSAALMLLLSAAKYAEGGEDGQWIPPIPVITTIGNKVRVWIAWHDEDEKLNDRFNMHYIWEGNMTWIRDIIGLQIILDNVHTWATRVLKPLLSHYISRWRANNK